MDRRAEALVDLAVRPLLQRVLVQRLSLAKRENHFQTFRSERTAGYAIQLALEFINLLAVAVEVLKENVCVRIWLPSSERERPPDLPLARGCASFGAYPISSRDLLPESLRQFLALLGDLGLGRLALAACRHCARQCDNESQRSH